MSLLYLVWTGLRYMSNKRFFNFLSVLASLHLMQAAEWTPTPTESKASLRAIKAVSDREVWVSGTGGTVLRTVDAGKHWTRVAGLPTDLDFRGLQTFDGRTVLLMSAGSGEKSRIYRTLDSGARWTLVHQNQIPEAFFDSIAFHDGLRGLVVGDPVDGKFFLLSTSDGGATWLRLPGPTAREGEAAFAASNTSLAVTRAGLAWFATGGVLGGRVFSSYDWGRTWTATQTTVPHDVTTAGAFSLALPDDKHGFAVGGDYKKENAAEAVLSETRDGGASWVQAPGPTGYRSAIVSDGHRTVATGPAGTDYKVSPKAKWQVIPGAGFHALSLESKGKVVWACGANGRIAFFRLR